MTPDELDRSLRQLRLGGMADVLSLRSQQARAENLGPLDFIGLLVHDELQRRQDRLVERRVKAAGFRDHKTLDTFDWKFNAIDRALIFELANGRFIEQHEDVLLLGNAGVGKSHIAQAIGMAVIHAGFRVLYREAHVLFGFYDGMLIAVHAMIKKTQKTPTQDLALARQRFKELQLWQGKTLI